ncbi:hypothetical protein B0H11DRAFT_2102287 [Mycena galericulata]|nr:hypothetical protein B0H11DRAFT_2102287 [Mycena galericulata]
MGVRMMAARARETTGITLRPGWYRSLAIPTYTLIFRYSSTSYPPPPPHFHPLPLLLPVLSSPSSSGLTSPPSLLSTSFLVHPRPIHDHFCHHPHHLVPLPPLLLLFAHLLHPISLLSSAQITSACALIVLLRTFHIPACSSSPIFQSFQGWKYV